MNYWKGILWFGSALLFGVLFAFAVMWATPAPAHDHANHELDRWYRQQYSEKGPCCDGEEAHHVGDVDWDSTCENSKCHYRVFLYNKWWAIDDAAVVQGPNLSGTALVWAVPTRKDNDEIYSVFIRYFMPGTGG